MAKKLQTAKNGLQWELNWGTATVFKVAVTKWTKVCWPWQQ